MTLIAYASAGHGHKMAAQALEEAFHSQERSERVEIMDLLSISPPIFSKTYAGIYWLLIHYFPPIWKFFFWLFNLQIIHRFDHFMKRNFKTGALSHFESLLKLNNPKHLVFTHFLGIHNAIALRHEGAISSSIEAIVTDFYAHALWIHDKVDKYFVMSNETREDMILRWGVKEEKIHVTGIPVSRNFSPNTGKKKERSYLETLGLQRDRLTLLFTSGSFGIGPTEHYLQSLAPLSERIQVIIVCGNNSKMKNRLLKTRFAFPAAILGFVNNMNELMDVSDLLVAKPGGITTCEALIKSLPMLISNVIPGQEEGNLKLLELHNACWRLLSPRDLTKIVKNILDNPKILEEKQRNISAIAKPNATRDIVDIILKS